MSGKASGFAYRLCGASPSDEKPCIYYLGLPQEMRDTEKALEDLPRPVVYIVIDD